MVKGRNSHRPLENLIRRKGYDLGVFNGESPSFLEGIFLGLTLLRQVVVV